MNKTAQMDVRARAELFTETADKMGLPEATIEKDFWVCWALKQLFSTKEFEGRILFKGGTSLSKIFHAINRFSEDIDLAVDYAALGFTGEKDPRREGLSKSTRNNILDEMMVECRRYIGEEFLNVLRAMCREILGTNVAWSLQVSGQDPTAVQFRYPAASSKTLAYIAPQVVLELGTRLVPPEQRIAALERDYRNMGVMIFGEARPSDWIMEKLSALEKEINQ